MKIHKKCFVHALLQARGTVLEWLNLQKKKKSNCLEYNQQLISTFLSQADNITKIQQFFRSYQMIKLGFLWNYIQKSVLQ